MVDGAKLNKDQDKIIEAQVIVVEEAMQEVSSKLQKMNDNNDTVSNLYETLRQKFELTATLDEFSDFMENIYLHNDKTYEFIKLINAKLVNVVTDSSVSLILASLQEIIANLAEGMVERSRNISIETDDKIGGGNFNIVALSQFAGTIDKYYKLLKTIQNDYSRPELDYRLAMFGKEQKETDTASLSPEDFKNLITKFKENSSEYGIDDLEGDNEEDNEEGMPNDYNEPEDYDDEDDEEL